MANEDNSRLWDVNTALSSNEGGDYSKWMNRVLDDIESSHVTWSEKQELYHRIETLVESNSLKDAQIDKLTRQQKLNVDDV